jgi:diguanylate cyclase (GGDEF)-like protein
LNIRNSNWWQTPLLPGGVVFLLAFFSFSGGILKVSPAELSFYYTTVFLGGLVLAWRFHSGRTFAALILVLLAHHAVEFFSAGHIPVAGPGRTALDAVSFFLAANFVWLAAAGEFGFTIASFAPRLGVLLLESTFVAVICRPQPAWGSTVFRGSWLPPVWFTWTRLSQFSCAVFLFAVLYLFIGCVISRKQIDAGLAWALAAAACAFSSGGVGRTADGYIGTAGLLLLVSVVEMSYRMAYHDELTGIPSRRALNDTAAALEPPFAIAVVDVDHFKRFNDTYGHETGDEVLRMVAAQLGKVTGGGRAFRVGGEEFTVLFERKLAEEVIPHLEQLRQMIEETTFRLRGLDRRVVARGPERRTSVRSSSLSAGSRRLPQASDLRVTVSIGVAEALGEGSFQAVLERADKTLYRAKQNGRNRVEVDGRRDSDAKPMRRKKSKAKSA